MIVDIMSKLSVESSICAFCAFSAAAADDDGVVSPHTLKKITLDLQQNHFKQFSSHLVLRTFSTYVRRSSTPVVNRTLVR